MLPFNYNDPSQLAPGQLAPHQNVYNSQTQKAKIMVETAHASYVWPLWYQNGITMIVIGARWREIAERDINIGRIAIEKA